MERSGVGPGDLDLVASARSAWSGLGSMISPTLDAVELWWIELPFLHPVSTAKTTFAERPLALVKVAGRVGGTLLEGWGECAALGEGDYVEENVATAFATLERELAPALVGVAATGEGSLPPPSGLDAVRRSAPESPMAFAALEMAVADAHLRAEQRSFASLLAVDGCAVEAGAVVGTFDTTAHLVDAVGALVDTGYRRVKMKIAPGRDLEPLQAVTTTFASLRVQVDANGSYTEADGAHLRQLDRFGLLCLEQPYPPTELAAHARLAARLTTPICLDESLDGPADVARALEMGACSVVEVKPARLGGIGAALEVIEACLRDQVPLWIGGMFESGFARGVNTAIAALPGFAWPGDLTPATSYLGADVVSAPAPDLGATLPTVVPPSGPGLGRPPDPDLLERFGVRHVVLSAAGR
jgi:O-succinylbenzoate synthase